VTEQASTKAATVLIVDDTPENIDILKGVLKEHYVIKAATKGTKALDVARTTPVDLILLDIMMPEMDGYEVCRQLQEDERTRDIPVIFVTALHEVTDETRGFEVGAVDYISKPISAAVVLARVRTHLALKEARERLQEWNSNLKSRLLQSVAIIREKSQSGQCATEQSPALKGLLQIVDVIAGMYELMGGPFALHGRIVSELAGDAAQKMNLDAEAVAKIRLAGLLLDVGNIGLVAGQANRHLKEMSFEEQREYRLHPVRGQELFESLEELRDVGILIRGHHESYNGMGYPDELKGEEIPLGARLLAIADFIDQTANTASCDHAEQALTGAHFHARILLDPNLIQYFHAITRIVYFDRSSTPDAE
jgi:putative two-component system response regulator